MRFANSTLNFLLTAGLLTAGLLPAQAGTPDALRDMDNPVEMESGQDREGDPARKPSSMEDLQAMGLHGIGVEVRQDPIRIAPGENGTLVLLVHLPQGRTVEKGGQVVMKQSQGPLKLGTPIWDPPLKGKSAYSDVIVIKIALSIDAKARFGKPMFQGSVRLRGDFGAAAGPGAEIVADGGISDPLEIPPGQRPGLDPGRAEIRFQSLVHIGPPMPKATRGQNKKAAARKSATPGTQGGPGKAASAGGNPRAIGPADAVPGAGTARTGSREDPRPATSSGEEAPDLADEGGKGFPWWILSVALGVLALLSFAVQSKKA